MNKKDVERGASSSKNWLQSLTWQTEFAGNLMGSARRDGENNWPWFERATSFRKHALKQKLRPLLELIRPPRRQHLSIDWLHENADKLWETRCLLADDLSQLLFDSSLVLRMTSHRQYYFPRVDFDDIIEVHGLKPFTMEGLPHDYLGLPLQVTYMTLRLPGHASVDLQVILADGTVTALNSYRQYLVTRDNVCLAPSRGEIVLDCGACIGDVSTLFAAMVGNNGEIHAFDPLPLHNRYCDLQKKLNPSLAHAMHFNTFAVSSHSSKAASPTAGSGQIVPGLRADEASFDCISLDDYVADHRLRQVDFIKMDIEGAEMAALEGATETIRKFKPRLAISGYHKPKDMWELPQKIMQLNPGYKLTFGHHSPVQWESVFYATAS